MVDQLELLMKLPQPQDTTSHKDNKNTDTIFKVNSSIFRENVWSCAADRFPLLKVVLEAFETLKTDVARSIIQAIDLTSSFTVEIDPSEYYFNPERMNCGILFLLSQTKWI